MSQTNQNNTTSIKIKRLPNFCQNSLPQYETEMSAGMDLGAAIADDITLAPGARKIIPCGIAIALPAGFEAQVRSRSGLAIKKGIMVLNSPGTIDADYRGEVCVILANLSDEAFVIKPGDRIAQMVIARYTQAQWQEVEQLDQTQRGAGGFGSTGTAAGDQKAS